MVSKTNIYITLVFELNLYWIHLLLYIPFVLDFVNTSNDITVIEYYLLDNNAFMTCILYLYLMSQHLNKC